MPAYIASLPIRPSEPTTPAPFTLPMPTPNTMANPTSNYCGYGWESAVAECFHACPSGLDTDCPGGRSCHVSFFLLVLIYAMSHDILLTPRSSTTYIITMKNITVLAKLSTSHDRSCSIQRLRYLLGTRGPNLLDTLLPWLGRFLSTRTIMLWWRIRL